ncbi:hypothetical protein GCM10028812_41140 [Ancylobacter sonchi]
MLPAIHRLKDAEQDGALRDLLSVLAEQAAILEEDLDQLYDDQFIETCADWAAPYIGGLIGYRTLHGVVPTVSSPRAEVANTIAARRRKGTASMMEQLAPDVTGWQAHVVEFFERLAATQYLNHQRPQARLTADLRDWEALERRDTAFDRLPHGVDVRSIAHGRGRYNIPNVGLFLWRLEAFPLERAMPARVDARRFRFNPLGLDAPLFTHPETEPTLTHLATPLNVPAPIGRRVLAARDAGTPARRLERYYGAGRSLLIETRAAPGDAFVALAADEVEVCNLSDRPGDSWAVAGPSRAVAIDPQLGRLLFRDARPAGSELRVSLHHGFSGPMGGGQYERGANTAADDAGGLTLLRVSGEPGDIPTIQAALDTLAATGGIVEIADNRTYAEALALAVPAGATLILRAANGKRPTLVSPGDITVSVDDEGAEASLVLDGLLVAGGGLVLAADAVTGLRRLVIRDTTLVPGRTLAADGTPAGDEPSLVADIAGTDIVLERCIVGGLRVSALSQLSVADSLVDATSPAGLAYAGTGAGGTASPGGALTLVATTVIGGIYAEAFALVSNAIVVAEPGPDTSPVPVRAERLQQGCVRFSYVPPNSATPRRYRCQPDQEVAAALERRARETGAELSEAQSASVRAGIQAWLKPSFTSLRYGRPGYGQLATRCPVLIGTGADDEAEMGAFHSLFQAQRETNLRVRVSEYLRFGLEAGLFYET